MATRQTNRPSPLNTASLFSSAIKRNAAQRKEMMEHHAKQERMLRVLKQTPSVRSVVSAILAPISAARASARAWVKAQEKKGIFATYGDVQHAHTVPWAHVEPTLYYDNTLYYGIPEDRQERLCAALGGVSRYSVKTVRIDASVWGLDGLKNKRLEKLLSAVMDTFPHEEWTADYPNGRMRTYGFAWVIRDNGAAVKPDAGPLVRAFLEQIQALGRPTVVVLNFTANVDSESTTCRKVTTVVTEEVTREVHTLVCE